MCRWIAVAALLGLAACAEDETTTAEPAAPEAQAQQTSDASTDPNRAPTDTGASPVQTAAAAHPAEHVEVNSPTPSTPARSGNGSDASRAPTQDRAADPRTTPPGAALPAVPRPQDTPPDKAPKSTSPLPSTTPPDKMPEQQPPSFSPPEKSPSPADPPNRVPVPGQIPDAVPLSQ